jgi:predicted transposase/invertase (TIGR01784 family)
LFPYLLSGNTTAKTNEATGKTFGEVKLKQIYLSFDLFNLREEECKTPLENMVYILKNMNLFDMSPFKEKNNAFKRLLDVANLEAMTSHERAVYDENLKIYRDWRNTLEYAVEEAEMKGVTKGKAEGKVEEQRQIAANFKKQGVNIETIAQCTGLSVEEIDKL